MEKEENDIFSIILCMSPGSSIGTSGIVRVTSFRCCIRNSIKLRVDFRSCVTMFLLYIGRHIDRQCTDIDR